MNRVVSVSFLTIVLMHAGTVGPAGAQGFEDREVRRASLSGSVSVSLRDAVQIALERNPDLVVRRLQIDQADAAIGEAQGAYDPVVDLSGLAGRRDIVVASRFYPTGTYVERENTYNAGIAGLMPTGSRYGVDLTYQLQDSTSNTQSLSPQYSANLNFTVSQPLMRDFGRDVNDTPITVAERQRDMSRDDLETGMAAMIYQVVESYWTLVFLEEDLEVKRSSLQLAEALLAQNEELFGAGRVAAVSVHEARAGVFERQEEVIVAENQVAAGEDRLKALLYADLEDVSFDPADGLGDVASDVDVSRSFQAALAGRPELARLETERDQREHEVDFATNQMRPRLDLNLTYGLSGLSGRPNDTLVNPGNPLLGTAGDTVEGSVFAGNTGTLGAFRDFFQGQGFDSWSVELRYEFTLGNRTAESRLAASQVRQRETEATLASARESVLLQIRDAARNIMSARDSVEAARAAIMSMEEQLAATELRFDAGLATSYEVLVVEDDLANARSRELRALLAHNVAQAALQLAEGSILSVYDVQLQ